MTADSLIATIRSRGGRVNRTLGGQVFVLTTDPQLVDDLKGFGAKIFKQEPYERVPGGTLEWDIIINQIPVDGETTIFEAAA